MGSAKVWASAAPAGIGEDESEMRDARALYLDVMKRCLTNFIYGDSEEVPVVARGLIQRMIVGACHRRGIRLVRGKPLDPETRASGADWPPTAHTMIGLKRLDNLQMCVEDVLARRVPGDFIETGVWRGGATIFMRAVLKAYGVSDRSVWVADSFQGLPPPNSDKYPHDAGDLHHTYEVFAVSIEQVKSNFAKYGLLDDQVRFLKGWFCDTLPTAPMERLAIIRLDGDMYQSTMDAIENLYPKLSIGGYLIVDDYGCIPATQRAIDDYRDAHGIGDEILPIDWAGGYWQRSS